MAVHYAFLYGNQQLCQRCVEKGAVLPVDRLRKCVQWDNRPFCELLLKNGADPNSGLKEAAKRFNQPLCQFFLEKGAKRESLEEIDLNSLLVKACKRLSALKRNEAVEEFILYLLGLGLAIDLDTDIETEHAQNQASRQKVKKELSPLTAAVEAGKIRLVEALLKRGAVVRSDTIKRATAADYYNIVRKLLLYAPLMYDNTVVNESRARFKTFLLCLKRSGIRVPRDVLRCILVDEMRPLIAHRLRNGAGIENSLQAFAKNAIWGALPEALVAEMREALTTIKEDAVNGDSINEILGDPGMLLQYLKDDIQELCNGRALALLPG